MPAKLGVKSCRFARECISFVATYYMLVIVHGRKKFVNFANLEVFVKLMFSCSIFLDFSNETNGCPYSWLKWNVACNLHLYTVIYSILPKNAAERQNPVSQGQTYGALSIRDDKCLLAISSPINKPVWKTGLAKWV